MFIVIPKTREISEAIQKLAFKKGYTWAGRKTQEIDNTNKEALFFNDDKSIQHSDKEYSNRVYKNQIVSIERAVELLGEEKIELHGYIGEFSKDQVKFGCKTISKETVDKVVEELKKGKNTNLNIFVQGLCPEINEALQKLAFKFGLTWASSGTTVWEPYRKQIFFRERLYSNASGCKKVSVEEAIKLLTNVSNIKIGDDLVIFEENQIKVGQYTISEKDILKIQKRLEKM